MWYITLDQERDDDIDWIYENLYIANAATGNNEEVLGDHNITHVIDLISHKKTNTVHKLKYLHLSLKDTPDCDILDWVSKVTRFIELSEAKEEEPRFCFYCSKGLSRSVAVMAGYLICKGKR